MPISYLIPSLIIAKYLYCYEINVKSHLRIDNRHRIVNFSKQRYKMKKLITLSLLVMSTMVMAENKIVLEVGLFPAGSFQATSLKPKGALKKNGNTFSADKIIVSVESFKTGIDLRDEHFWKHLKSSTQPKITLANLKAQGGKGIASLEVNGVKKPIQINYKEIGKEVHASFVVKNSDFKLPKVDYLGVGVSNDVKINVVLEYN